jgi:hypothetical protein
MVKPLQHHPHSRPPVSAVVNSADAEEQHAGQSIDCRAEAAIIRGGQPDQHHAGDEGQGCGHGVDPAAPLGLDGQQFGYPDGSVVKTAGIMAFP